MKKSSEQVHLNNFRRAPDSCHREEGKSSRELFEKVRVNAPLFGVSGFWVGFCASKYSWHAPQENNQKFLSPGRKTKVSCGYLENQEK